jgi:hypothetical protein
VKSWCRAEYLEQFSSHVKMWVKVTSYLGREYNQDGHKSYTNQAVKRVVEAKEKVSVTS